VNFKAVDKMSKYTLTYFNYRSAGEISRWVFAAANQPYNDVRISTDGDRAEWQKLKPTTPFGQMPILEVDGVKLCQSNAIAHYLAREFGLAGKSSLDQARVTMIVECAGDVLKAGLQVFMESDEGKKVELRNKFENDLKTWQKCFDQFLTDNHDTGYFVGDSLSLADIVYAVLMERLGIDGHFETHLDEFPRLKQLNENVRSYPTIAEWIAKRPVTPF